MFRGDAIDDTDHARRVFVPQDQCLDQSAMSKLNEVAVANRTAKYAHLYGPHAVLTPGQRLRHALVVPDLAAPKNDAENVRYDEIAALIVLDDRDTISFAVHQPSCSAPRTWAGHKNWVGGLSMHFGASCKGTTRPLWTCSQSRRRRSTSATHAV